MLEFPCKDAYSRGAWSVRSPRKPSQASHGLVVMGVGAVWRKIWLARDTHYAGLMVLLGVLLALQACCDRAPGPWFGNIS